MGPIFFLLAVLVVGALVLLFASSFGEGLVDDAKQWWRLRSIQIAGIVAALPQLVELWVIWFGDVWPDASHLLLQVLPGKSGKTITIIGALFAIARLIKQRGLPRIPAVDPTDQAGA